jgi:hypothetical protein
MKGVLAKLFTLFDRQGGLGQRKPRHLPVRDSFISSAGLQDNVKWKR